MQIPLSEIKDSVTIAGVAIGAGSLFVATINARMTSKTNRARHWLDLRTQFAKHDEVHRNLRPGGKWAGASPGPVTAEEWAMVEAYMGLFEHCESMLAEKLIDTATFKAIYEYRLKNIVASNAIKTEKLVKRADGWRLFLGLLKRVGIQI